MLVLVSILIKLALSLNFVAWNWLFCKCWWNLNKSDHSMHSLLWNT